MPYLMHSDANRTRLIDLDDIRGVMVTKENPAGGLPNKSSGEILYVDGTIVNVTSDCAQNVMDELMDREGEPGPDDKPAHDPMTDDLKSLLQGVGDNIAEVIDQMLKCRWQDNLGHPAKNNVAMHNLKASLEAMIAFRAKHLGYSDPDEGD